MNKRQFSKLDEFIIHIDNLLGEFSKSGDREIQREYPAKSYPQPELNGQEKKHLSKKEKPISLSLSLSSQHGRR